MINVTYMENTTSSKCESLLLEVLSKDAVTSPETSTAYPDEDANDALFYIITVLLFYACSIVILMIKYIRREKQEAEFRNYYYEYVSRDKFQQPQYQNFEYMCQIMKSLTKGKGRKVSPELSPKLEEIVTKDKPEDVVSDVDINQKLINETPV